MTASRFTPLALALSFALAACDATAPEVPVAEVSIGATYDASTIAMKNPDSGEVLYDYLGAGAEISVTFTDARSFTARLFVPYEALVATGQADDPGDVDLRIAGTYRQADGLLSFQPNEDVDSFFGPTGWTISADGSTLRHADRDSDAEFATVLTRN